MNDLELKQREEIWKEKRKGRLTSSLFTKLAHSGEGSNVFQSNLWEVLAERRYNQRAEKNIGYNGRFGNEKEPYAVEWRKQHVIQHAMETIKHCSCPNDYEEIVFNTPFKDVLYGDSPDYHVCLGNETKAVGEIKCVMSLAKYEIERRSTLSGIPRNHEYYPQFISHFIGDPDVQIMEYLCYLGTHEDPAMHLGFVRIMKREDYEDDIQALENFIRDLDKQIDDAIEGDEVVRFSKPNW